MPEQGAWKAYQGSLFKPQRPHRNRRLRPRNFRPRDLVVSITLQRNITAHRHQAQIYRKRIQSVLFYGAISSLKLPSAVDEVSRNYLLVG